MGYDGGWKTVIGLLVLTLTLTLTEGKVKVGDLCCADDWNTLVAPHVTALKAIPDQTSAGFKTAFDAYASKKYEDDNPEGICQGKLSFKCVGTGKDGLCQCNTEAPFDSTAQGTDCVGAKTGSFCSTGPKNEVKCNAGTCEIKNAELKTGQCGGGSGTDLTGGGGENGTDKSGGPHGPHSHLHSSVSVLWVMVGAMAHILLIPSSSF